MKRKGVFIVSGVIGLIFLLSTLPTGMAYAQEKVISLKIANFFPPPSKQSRLLQEFSEEIEKRSGGRIKTQYFAGGSLLAAPAMYKGVQSGIADIGYSHVFYTPGRMPVSEGIGLPLGVPSGWVGAHMAFDFFNKYKPKEFNDVKILAIHANAPSMIIVRKQISTLDEMKGVSIRAPSISGEIIAALGGTPAPTPMVEVYDAISKGVVDGVWGPYETLKTFRFAEVAKYVTACWQIGASYPFYLAMNKNSYNKLPRDLQELVNVMSGEYQERYALVWNEIELAGYAFGVEKGMKYIELSKEQGEKWQKAVEPVITNYIKNLAGKGYKEQEAKEMVEYMRARVAYWTEKQMEYKISSPVGPAGMRPEAYVIKK